MPKIAVKYWHSYAVNKPGKGIRGRIAHALVRLAQRVDTSLWCMAVSLESSPELTNSQKAECLAHGFRHVERMFESEVRHAAGEIAMRAAMPNLFKSEKSRG
jgi:hypothetical protein